MAKYKTYKFQQIAEMEYHLNGGVFGGSPRTPFLISAGLTLTFSKPSALTVTFTSGAVPGQLSFPEFRTQLTTALAAVTTGIVGDRIVIVETTPSQGVVITGGTALKPLAMDNNGATGRVYQYPDGVSAAAVPHYINSYFSEGHYFLLVRE